MMVFRHLRVLFSSVLFLTSMVAIGQSSLVSEDFSSPYQKGLALFKKGQYGNSQRLMDGVANEEFNNSREVRASAAYYAALCAMRLYNGDAASRVEKFAQNFELSPLVNQLYLEYANARFSLKKYAEASVYYEKVNTYRINEEQKSEFQFKAAYAHMHNGQTEKARALFFDLKDKNTEFSNSSKYYYAHLLYVDSNYTEALTNFLPLVDDATFGPLIPYYLAHIYYKLENFDKLLEIGEELVEAATPTRAPEIAKLVADAFYNRNDFVNAAKYLDLYKSKGGKLSQDDHFQIGYAHYQSKNYHEAIQSFNKIVKGKKSLRQSAYYHLGDCYLKIDDKQKAITAFKAASELSTDEATREDAYFNYAKLVYEFSDPYEDAISTLSSYLEEFPASTHKKEVHRYLANLYITTKDYDRALLAIRETGLDSPEMQAAYQKISFFRASELFKALRFVGALNKYKESLRYPLNNALVALANYWSGESHYRLGDYENALASFEKFRSTNGSYNMSEFSLSHYQTAYCHYKKFEFDNAAAHFRDYVKHGKTADPRLPDAYLRMADCYMLKGDYLVAGEFYSKALQVKTNEPDYALFKSGECLGLAGKKEKKVIKLQTLLRDYPNSVYAEEAQFLIANTYLQLDDNRMAESSFNQFIQQNPKSKWVAKAKLQKGLVYSNNDQNEKAIAAFKLVVNEYAGSEESIEAVGLARLVYARMNKIDDYLDWVGDLSFVNFSKGTLDSTSYNTAFDQYSTGNCEGAISGFETYLRRFEKGLFVLKANYYMADCALKAQNEEMAAEAYQNILDSPQNEYTKEATHYWADKYYYEKNYPKALVLYDNLTQLVSSKAQGLAAQTGIMRSSLALGDTKKASVYAQLILDSEISDDALKQECVGALAQLQLEEEDYEGAIENLDWLIANTGGETKAKAMYQLAEVRFKQNLYEASTRMVYKMIEELPDRKEWKLKGTILIARNYWMQEDIFQANYALDFVIAADYNAEITQNAKDLKSEIAMAEQRKAQMMKQELQRKSDSLDMDAGNGIQIIDEKEEVQDSLR